MIADLEDMMYHHLKLFETNTRSKPDKILFYRVCVFGLAHPLHMLIIGWCQ